MSRLTTLLLSVFLFASCASVSTVSVGPYTPQNAVKLDCSINVEEFIYLPYEEFKSENSSIGTQAKYGGLSSPNKILSSEATNIYLTVPVASYFQIGTALELERSGATIDIDAPYSLSATVNEFKVDVLARTVTWYFTVTYTIKNRAGAVVATTTFEEQNYKTGKKFSSEAPYNDVVNYVIYSGYMHLLSEMRKNYVCSGSSAPKSKDSSNKSKSTTPSKSRKLKSSSTQSEIKKK